MATDIILDHVQSSLRDLPPGAVSQRAKDLAGHYGVSVKTVLSWASQRGLRWRKERKTKGESKASRQAVLEASTLLLAARRTSKTIPMPACDAKMILEDAGIET